MNYLKVVAFAMLGVLCAPLLRAMIFRHSVPTRAGVRDTCPHCHQLIIHGQAAVYWLPPSGRCPRCATRLGPPTGTVELASAGLLGLYAWLSPDLLTLLALSWTGVIGIALAGIDVAVHRLPDRLVATALAGSLSILSIDAIAQGDLRRLGVAGLCAMATAGAYLILALVPRGLSLGDVKFGLVTGLLAGWLGVEWAVVSFGAAMALLWLAGLAKLLTALPRRQRLPGYIPHGPHMLGGLVIAACRAMSS